MMTVGERAWLRQEKVVVQAVQEGDALVEYIERPTKRGVATEAGEKAKWGPIQQWVWVPLTSLRPAI